MLAYGVSGDSIDELLAEGKQRGFPGMLGSLDLNYSITYHNYTMGYYLADGIYPPWSTLVKTIPYPQENKHKNFVKAQESARKDVERAFEVFQARFAIVRGPACFWDRDTLDDIMKACVIMHNMIVEDEHITKNIEDLNDDVSNED
ncbi:hypothetical protein AB3S75_007543 [Citrus x aurantiifolia]